MFRGEEVRHLCVHCVERMGGEEHFNLEAPLTNSTTSDQSQLTLPLWEAVVRPTIVQLIRVTHLLEPQLLTDEELRRFLCGFRSEEFEELVLDRFLAMVWRRSRSDIRDPKTVVSI